MTCIVTFIALALFISTTASALYGEASDVVTLTTDNFEASVLNSDAIWLIHFYAVWSGHCKALAPRFTQAAHALKGSVHFGAVDGILHVKLSEEYNVQSYSTLMYFGHNKSLPIRYEGERSSKDFVKGALALTLTDALDRLDVTLTDPRTNNLFDGTAVVELHDGTFFETLMDHRNDKGWSVLFYSPHSRNSLELVSTWIAAASELKGTTLFGAIDATMSRRVTRRFNIYDYPTVISFAPGLQQPELYRGSLSKDDVVRAAMVKADEISFHALKQHTYAGVTLLQKSLLKSVGSLINSALPVLVAVVCWLFVADLWTRARPQR